MQFGMMLFNVPIIHIMIELTRKYKQEQQKQIGFKGVNCE